MALYIIAAVFAALFSPLEVQAAADVTAPAGRVAGLEQDVDGTTVNAFLGIPFAHPPVGERRFRRAERLEPWDGTYDATRKPNACVQVVDPHTPELAILIPKTNLSEDCLYLNVWQPTPLPTAAAVMVWIHGGAFSSGSSALDIYDGRYLAATEGVLVVSMNYRLDTLGLAYTGTDEAPGNMGLTDQLLALQWVKDNIASFGGDPSKVTILGDSTGGESVGYHLLSPESRNVFNRAIMQSGTALKSGTALHPHSVSSASDMSVNTKAFAASLGCATEQGPTAMMACLREQDAQTLVDGYWPIYPVIDGSFLPESPPEALRNGEFKHTDILLGFNSNEAMMIYILYGVPAENIDREQFIKNLKIAFPSLDEMAVDAVAFQYTDWLRPDDSDMYRDALDAADTDRSYACPSFATARAHTRVGTTVYMYEFAHHPTNPLIPDWAGAYHGAEAGFVLGHPLNPIFGYTDKEAVLSWRMMRYWANFARTGNPNDNGESVWSPFTETSRGYLMLDTNAPRMVTGQKATECAFWDKYVPSLMNKTAAPEQCGTTTGSASGPGSAQSLAGGLLLGIITAILTVM